MNKPISFFVLLFTCALSCVANELKLRFDRPADFFEESFVIGNGSQGAIIYGNPYRERISLNDITLWSGEPDTAAYNPSAHRWLPEIREALRAGDYSLAEELQHNMQGHNSQYYMPLGNLLIDFKDKTPVRNYNRELDLNTAVSRVSYKKGDNDIVTEYFASAPDSLIVVKLIASNPIDLSISFESLLPYECSSGEDGISAAGYAPYGFVLTEDNGRKVEALQYDPLRGIHFRSNIAAVS